MLEAPAVDDCGEVHEVAGLGPVEESEDLVEGQFLAGQGEADRRALGREQPESLARSSSVDASPSVMSSRANPSTDLTVST